MALAAAVCAVGRSFTRRRGEILLVAVAVVDAGVPLLSGHDGALTRLFAAQSVSTKQDLDSYFESDTVAVNKSNTVTTIPYRYSCEC